MPAEKQKPKVASCWIWVCSSVSKSHCGEIAPELLIRALSRPLKRGRCEYRCSKKQKGKRMLFHDLRWASERTFLFREFNGGIARHPVSHNQGQGGWIPLRDLGNSLSKFVLRVRGESVESPWRVARADSGYKHHKRHLPLRALPGRARRSNNHPPRKVWLARNQYNRANSGKEERTCGNLNPESGGFNRQRRECGAVERIRPKLGERGRRGRSLRTGQNIEQGNRPNGWAREAFVD